jgi:hypothetical protein
MTRRLDPPFLELAFYLGEANVDAHGPVLTPNIDTVAPRKLGVAGAVGLVDEAQEVEIQRGIMIFRTEGQNFCGVLRADRQRLTKLGRRVRDRFVQLADSIDCVYGAILVEYSLETPAELRHDSRSLAFRNFFLNRRALGPWVTDECLRIAGEDAAVERTAAGVYVSMSTEFNPFGRQVEPLEAQRRSTEIAAVLAKAAR